MSNFNQPVNLQNKKMTLKDLESYLAPRNHTESMLGLIKMLQDEDQEYANLDQKAAISARDHAFEQQKFAAQQERNEKLDALNNQVQQTNMAKARHEMKMAELSHQHKMMEYARVRAMEMRAKEINALKLRMFQKVQLSPSEQIKAIERVQALKSTEKELDELLKVVDPIDLGITAVNNPLGGEQQRQIETRAALITEQFLKGVGITPNVGVIEQIKDVIKIKPTESKEQYNKRIEVFRNAIKEAKEHLRTQAEDGFFVNITPFAKKSLEDKNEAFHTLDPESQFYVEKGYEQEQRSLHGHDSGHNKDGMDILKNIGIEPNAKEGEEKKSIEGAEKNPGIIGNLMNRIGNAYTNSTNSDWKENSKQVAAGVLQTPTDMLYSVLDGANKAISDSPDDLKSPDLRDTFGASKDPNILHDVANMAGFVTPYGGIVKGLNALDKASKVNKAVKSAAAAGTVSGLADQGDIGDKLGSAALGASIDFGLGLGGKALSGILKYFKGDKTKAKIVSDMVKGDKNADIILSEIGDNVDPISLVKSTEKFKNATAQEQKQILESLENNSYTTFAGDTASPQYAEMVQAVDKGNALKKDIANEFGSVTKEDAGSVIQKYNQSLEDKYSKLYNEQFKKMEDNILTMPLKDVEAAKIFDQDSLILAANDPTIRAQQEAILKQLDKVSVGSKEAIALKDELKSLEKLSPLTDEVILTPNSAHQLKSKAKSQNRKLEMNPTETTQNAVTRNKELSTRIDTALEKQLTPELYSEYNALQNQYRTEVAPFKQFKKVVDSGKTDSIYDAVKNFGKTQDDLKAIQYIAEKGTEKDVTTLLGSVLSKGTGDISDMTGSAIKKRFEEMTTTQRDLFAKYIPDLKQKLDKVIAIDDIIAPYRAASAVTQTGKLAVTKLQSMMQTAEKIAPIVVGSAGFFHSAGVGAIGTLVSLVWKGLKSAAKGPSVKSNQKLIEQVRKNLFKGDKEGLSKAKQWLGQSEKLYNKFGDENMGILLKNLILAPSNKSRSIDKRNESNEQK